VIRHCKKRGAPDVRKKSYAMYFQYSKNMKAGTKTKMKSHPQT